MKELGNLRKEGYEESCQRNTYFKPGLSPEKRWARWVMMKVKMRRYNQTQRLLTDLKREREAER